MIAVNIICIGKLKESYLRDASAEYSKRLGAFCKLNITEIQPKRLPDQPSEAEIDAALSAESKQILAKISQNSKIVAMCIEGSQMSSEQLAKQFETDAVSGTGSLSFIIGGSFGLSDEVKKRADLKLSMSKMTFPHQLARVMLLEQIYRAFQINSGGKYHK